MEIHRFKIPGRAKQVTIAPIGDFQWSGKNGPTAIEHLKRHIGNALDQDAYFIGVGDYIDFMSPSGRRKFKESSHYDTTIKAVEDKGLELTDEVYEKFLKPTKGRWIGMLHGHHYTDLSTDGNTDKVLATMLGAPYLGTSAHIRVEFGRNFFTLWAHHGVSLRKLKEMGNAWSGVDALLIGHTTKMNAERLSRPWVDWTTGEMHHHDYLLVNCGGFSKSNIADHRVGGLPHGDYAEEAMYGPSPLASPLLIGSAKSGKERAEVQVII